MPEEAIRDGTYLSRVSDGGPSAVGLEESRVGHG